MCASETITLNKKYKNKITNLIEWSTIGYNEKYFKSKSYSFNETFKDWTKLTRFELRLRYPLTTDMSNMFEGCYKLSKVNLSTFNTSIVTNMYCMFYGCSSLSSVDLSTFNTSSVRDKRYMFSRSSSLNTVILSIFIISSII